jgi:hypothetical protein
MKVYIMMVLRSEEEEEEEESILMSTRLTIAYGTDRLTH